MGRRLLTHVRDVMRAADAVPAVSESATLNEALLQMTRGGMGMTAIVTAERQIAGIFTDGDLRRLIEHGCDFATTRVSEVMSRTPRTISADALAVEAAEQMEQHRITQLLVADRDNRLAGALTTHDLMQAKVI